MKADELAGHTFGRLVVIQRQGSDKRGNARWLCRCSCGGQTVVLSHNLKTGHTKSCGCLGISRRNAFLYARRLTNSEMLALDLASGSTTLEDTGLRQSDFDIHLARALAKLKTKDVAEAVKIYLNWIGIKED